MDDNEMVTELRKRAESKAMAQALLADMGYDFQNLIPAYIADKFPDRDLGKEMGDKRELELGTLALAADVIEGTYEGDPIDSTKLAAMLRKLAEEEDDFAWRQDSEADDKKAEEELRGYGLLDDEDEDEDEDDGESEEELREIAESSRETAKFYREVADRVEAAKK